MDFSTRTRLSRSTFISSLKYLGPSQSLTLPVRLGIAFNASCNKLADLSLSLSLNAALHDVATSFNNESSSTLTPVGRSPKILRRVLLLDLAVSFFKRNFATPAESTLPSLNFGNEHTCLITYVSACVCVYVCSCVYMSCTCVCVCGFITGDNVLCTRSRKVLRAPFSHDASS